ncbi:hypothetical protein QWY28_10195 [Nocardioides sp. SOB77]|uniref:Outer membrane channel protein CpnT-like N-terminal domain-containing protein n=1 Tax=Nocardioides oceani TaxID=3058369 RepID=A0ABT8FF46_9ACTN|nr:hypothetical protein [Nocardioides oceani]MDN4173313.1 hypothetical protein [Nocardioides oceani]
MTVTVDAAGFDTAAEAFATANGVVAQFYGGLTSALAGYGSMAGDDQTSDEFARDYDTAAAEAVGAAQELVGALAGMARLTAATGANHRGANASSVYGADPPVYDGDQHDALPDTTVSVSSYTPPSAVGGDDPDTPQFWDMITDYLEGWTWPGADTGKLREAAGVWRQFGSNVERQTTAYLDSALGQLRAQRSPEVELAAGVTEDLRLQVQQLALHCEDIATACEDYATQVEAVRETVRGIMRDLAIEIGATAVVAGIASIFSGGAAAGGGAAVAGWRLSSAARKVIAAFSAMKAAVRGAAVAKLVRVAQKVPVLRGRLRRISEASNRARHERFVSELRAAMEKPSVRDPRLSGLMDELYRDGASVGSGSTAAAVRHELATGLPVGGKFHTEKAENMITALERWLRNNPEATPGDRAAAENVIRDMRDALAGR